MKQIRLLAQYYVDLMMKLGLVRFSMLLALALVVLAIVVQMAVTMVLHGQVESIDVIRSIFFGLLITPWAVYFLSVVVEQLEESRQRLSRRHKFSSSSNPHSYVPSLTLHPTWFFIVTKIKSFPAVTARWSC